MSQVKVTADSGGGTVSLKAPASTTGDADFQLTLPVDDGTANQYLKTDGSGALSWATVSSTPEGTAILSTGEGGGSKFLREDGDNTCSWQTVTAAEQDASTGDYTLTSGNLVIATAGKGIDFSATGGPSEGSDTSELLNDYEEGTFSPEVLNGWGVVDPTYSTNSGYYTKIGNVVYILFRIVLSGGSLNGNQLLIYKFPYGAKSTGGFNSALNGYANVANGNATAIHLQMDDDYTIHRVWYRGSSGNNAWSGNDGGGSFDIVFSGSYLI